MIFLAVLLAVGGAGVMYATRVPAMEADFSVGKEKAFIAGFGIFMLGGFLAVYSALS